MSLVRHYQKWFNKKSQALYYASNERDQDKGRTVPRRCEGGRKKPRGCNSGSSGSNSSERCFAGIENFASSLNEMDALIHKYNEPKKKGKKKK